MSGNGDPRGATAGGQADFLQVLEELATLTDGWDGYVAPAPSRYALDWAGRALDALRALELSPVAVVPSAEGGVGMAFRAAARYATLEIMNDGELVALTQVGDEEPTIWAAPVQSALNSTLAALRSFLEHDPRPAASERPSAG